jgi:polygalacturonase
MAEDRVPVEKRVFGDGSYLRPPFIQPYECENVLIADVRVRNSPFWNIHPVLCRNVTLRGVDVFGHGPNNDGTDPESVDHMLIEGCTFDTGDDCIAVNSGRNADGRRVNVPSQNILIRDCRMKEGHGGVVVGSQISGGARWVFAENCHMDSPDLWYAIRFKTTRCAAGCSRISITAISRSGRWAARRSRAISTTRRARMDRSRRNCAMSWSNGCA